MAVTAAFWYLKDLPLYETTKPYVVNLPQSYIPAGKRTNEDCFAYPGIRVEDIRKVEQIFTLDRNGFELSNSIPLGLQYEEFRDPTKVKDIYCENVKSSLLRVTGAESGHLLHQTVWAGD